MAHLKAALQLPARLPKGPLPRPDLQVTPNAVARALDAMHELREANAQIRANELSRIGRDVPVKKLKPFHGGHRTVSDPRFDDL